MGDHGRNSKVFVIIISIVVIALIIIGFVFTWKIVQKGQESSEPFYEIEQLHMAESMNQQECNYDI